MHGHVYIPPFSSCYFLRPAHGESPRNFLAIRQDRFYSPIRLLRRNYAPCDSTLYTPVQTARNLVPVA